MGPLSLLTTKALLSGNQTVNQNNLAAVMMTSPAWTYPQLRVCVCVCVIISEWSGENAFHKTGMQTHTHTHSLGAECWGEGSVFVWIVIWSLSSWGKQMCVIHKYILNSRVQIVQSSVRGNTHTLNPTQRQSHGWAGQCAWGYCSYYSTAQINLAGA